MDLTSLAPETLQLIKLAANAVGLVLGLIVFAVSLAQIGASWVHTHFQ